MNGKNIARETMFSFRSKYTCGVSHHQRHGPQKLQRKAGKHIAKIQTIHNCQLSCRTITCRSEPPLDK